MIEFLSKGGVVMIPIGLCSVVALAIIFERFWALRRKQVIPPEAVRRIEELVMRGDMEGGKGYCIASRSSYGNIILSGLRNHGERRRVIKEAVEEAGRQEVVHMERYLTLLGTIAAITPLLGLLGTVLGMIKVFSVISTVGVGDPGVLANGISEALITTASGLTIAIPALGLHRYFNRVIDKYVVELERFALVVVEQIKSGH
ncbi:MAG: MotA/TolQ/ExbB proton channel family protein [Magnetococcales bacterium]|nr:MotA/TolQ/ExbB proton channel family protein [Magnetococcales bacterium]